MGLKSILKYAARKTGHEIRRLPPFTNGASDDPYVEQRRLLGDDVRTIYEVGAANGDDCLRYVRMFPKATVYAFEPLPDSFVKIPVHDRIVPVASAASSYEGRATFQVASLPDASSLLPARINGSIYDHKQKPVGSVDVSVTTLDSFAKSHPQPDLLKMDAQGSELDILKGAETLRPRLIFSEVQFNPVYEGAGDFLDVAMLLRQRGYKLHNLYTIIYQQWGEIAWADAIFIRSDVSAGHDPT